MEWLKWPRRLTCKHHENSITMPLDIGEYEVIYSVPEGATVGWDGRITVQTKSVIKCLLCGGIFERHTTPHPRFDRTPRNERGWPLNADGSEMQIAEAS